jgi:hypothetical protein
VTEPLMDGEIGGWIGTVPISVISSELVSETTDLAVLPTLWPIRFRHPGDYRRIRESAGRIG